LTLQPQLHTGWEMSIPKRVLCLDFARVWFTHNLWFSTKATGFLCPRRSWGKSCRGTFTSLRDFKYSYTRGCRKMNYFRGLGDQHGDGIGIECDQVPFKTNATFFCTDGSMGWAKRLFASWEVMLEHWSGGLQQLPKEIIVVVPPRHFQVWVNRRGFVLCWQQEIAAGDIKEEFEGVWAQSLLHKSTTWIARAFSFFTAPNPFTM